MSDIRTLLERKQRELHAPPGSFERLLRRRDRKRRNQRITAGSVGIALFVAAIWIVTSLGPLHRTQTPGSSGGTGPVETGPTQTGPAETGPTVTGPPEPTPGSYSPWFVSGKDIAVGESFLDAWVDGDGEAAAVMFTPDGTFDEFESGILPALHDWFRAGGWTFRSEGAACWSTDSGDPRLPDELGVVECSFAYENDLTRALHMGPMEGGRLTLIIHNGRIEAAATQVGESYASLATHTGASYLADNMFRSPNRARSDDFGVVWDMFINWISTTHPEDFERMYDSDRGYPFLDPTSTGLWERYTGELVASPEALRGSLAEWTANQGFEFQARGICMAAHDRFWATATANDLREPDSAFYSTLADVEEETLAELRAIPIETDADRATMDVFAPLAERMIEVHRQQAEAAAAGDHQRLNELIGEEFDLRRELTLTIWGCLVLSGGPM